MAVVFVASRGSATATAAGTTFAMDMPAAASITPGNTLICSIAFRDVATLPTDPMSRPGDSVVQDLRGNFWRRIGYSVNAGASSAADNGAVTHIWICHVVFPYVNGDDVTFTAPITSRPMTHVAGEVFEFSGILRVSHPIDFELTAGNGTASSVATVTVPSAAGQLVFGSVAVATNPTLTGDADATNGAWTAISQNASTGIRRGSQHKIVTAAGAQTWDTTWTGTQQWAAAIVVLQVAPSAWPWNDAHLANPGYECPAGPEILPTSRTVTPIDTGTAYLFDAEIPVESINSSNVYWYGDITIPRDDVDVQHRVCVEVYPRGAELARTDPFIYTLGTPNFVVANNGATTNLGSVVAADLVTALSGSGSTYVVLPDPGTPDTTTPGSIDCYWDASALIPLQDTHRILNLRLSYVAWKDDGAAAQPGEGLAVFWRDESVFSSGAPSRATSLYGTWLVNDYKTQAKRVYRNLGEVNGLPRLGGNIGEQFSNVQACWTIRDLLHMNTGDRTTMFSLFGINGSLPSQETVLLDTVRLDVYLVPETRLAQSVRRVTSGVGFPGNLADQADGEKIQPLYAATNSGFYWTAPAVATDITVAVREPIVSSGSDWYSAQTDPDILNNTTLRDARYSTQEAVGPSVAMKSLTQPRETLDPQVTVRRVEWSNGQVAQGADDEPFGSMIQSISLIDFNSYSGFWPFYSSDNFLPTTAYTGSPVTQTIGVDGSTVYDAVKVLIKPSDLTVGALTITVEQPALTVLASATLTVADCLALPDVGNGFREVRLELNTAVMPAAAPVVTVRLASTNTSNAGWIPGIGYALQPRFNYQAFQMIAPADNVDVAVVLCCPIDDPDVEVSTGTATFPATSDRCITTSTDIPCLEIANAADYDYIGISRVVGPDVVPITVLNGTALGLEIEDTFSRTEANEWGDADTGQSWIESGIPYNVSGGQGRINVIGAGSAVLMQMNFGPDADVTVSAGTDVLSTGSFQESAIIAGGLDLNNFYVARLRYNSDQTMSIRISQMLAGVLSDLTSTTLPLAHTAGTMYSFRFRKSGNFLHAKAWDPITQPEPDWQVDFDDAASPLPAGNHVGVWGARNVGNTNIGALFLFDNFQVLETSNPLTWCDYGVPWDLISGSVEYLVTGYRENDRAEATVLVGPWAGSSVAPGAAFGLAGEDFLVAYVPVSESGELQVTWNPLNPIESMPLAGIDYQVALRASEQRGLSITVTVVADHLLRCELSDNSITYDESGLTYDEEGYSYDGANAAESFSSRELGGRSLSPSPYALIRSLENIDRLTLKLPGGHTRYVTADVGALVTTPVAGIYLAELTLTDTLLPGTYPYQSPGGPPVDGLDA